MSFARPLLLSLALAIAPMSVPMTAMAAGTGELQKRLEAEAAVTIQGRAVDAQALRDFYGQRHWRPAWTEGEGKARGEALLTAVKALAHVEGLHPAAYAIPEGATGADRDLLITDALARFLRDLSVGRMAPTRALGGMPEAAPARPAIAPLLKDLAAGQDLTALAASLPPPYVGYRRLKAALETYRALQEAGGWKPVAEGGSIKPGMEDERVPQIRRRLIATGELDAAHAQGNVLDDTLVAAVKKFQTRHGIEPDGAVGPHTLATMNVSVDERLRQITANLERWRWMPRRLDSHHIAVNIPAAQLELVRGGRIDLAMRVVVGEVKNPTPTMMTSMSSLVVNPTWTVPASIASKEILPKLRKDPGYLVANNMFILDAFPEGDPKAQGIGMDWSTYDGRFPYRLRQKPGVDNALGQLKFNLTNSDDIYLHDTPKRQYFGRIFRALSHGCVRLERPLDLAQAVLPEQWAGKVGEMVEDDTTRTLKLERPLTVYLMYMTAWADEDGTVQFRDDIYGHDGRLKGTLRKARPATAPAAQVAVQ